MQNLIAIWVICFVGLAILAAPAKAHPGPGIAVLPDGTIFVVDPEHDRLWKIGADRKPVVVAKVHAHHLGFDTDGRVSGEHTEWHAAQAEWSGSLWHLDKNGLRATIAGPGKDAFSAEFFPVFDAAGRRYAWRGNNNERTTSVLERWSADGGLEVLAGGPWGQKDGKGTEARLSSVGALAVRSDGVLMLSDGECLRELAADAMLTTVLCGGLLKKSGLQLFGGKSNHLTSIAFGRGGTFVANFSTGDVVFMGADDTASTWLKNDWRWPALGLAFREGALYVLEHRSSELRIRKSTDVGTAETIALVPTGE